MPSVLMAYSGSVTNGDDVIETLGAASSLTLRGAAIDNGSGRISNAGNGDTCLVSQTSITSAGIIAAMGNLLLSEQTLSNQGGATLASGGNLALEIARQVSNSGKINSGGTLTFDQAGATFTNSGEAYSGGSAVVNVSLLNNDGGRLGTGSGSGADLTLTSHQVSNQGGRIATDRDLLVNTHTVNALGELFAGRDLRRQPTAPFQPKPQSFRQWEYHECRGSGGGWCPEPVRPADQQSVGCLDRWKWRHPEGER
jgi:filamentous hemagglutinin